MAATLRDVIHLLRRLRLATPLVLCLSALASGCGGGTSTTDAGQGPGDAASRDSAVADAAMDAGVMDARPADGASDAASDAAPADAATDGAPLDAAFDATVGDGATPSDASVPADASSPDGPLPDGSVILGETVTHPAETPIAPATECTVTEDTVFVRSATHVPDCSPVTYDTNPPSGGNHYPEPAYFQTYDAPVPWGFLVHSEEHGGVVIAYDCPSGCPSLVASLQAIIDAEPDDPICASTPFLHRLILVPEPDLTVPIAAAAWGYTYRATCLDTASLTAFIEAHYAMSPESACFAGVDMSAGGWCTTDGGVPDAGPPDAGP